MLTDAEENVLAKAKARWEKDKTLRVTLGCWSANPNDPKYIAGLDRYARACLKTHRDNPQWSKAGKH